MLCHAAHIPVHLGSTALSVEAVIRDLILLPGEHAIVNDPFAGGTHLPDVTVVSPVHLPGQSSPAFYIANRAHHADVGGKVPGSLVPLYRDESGHWALTIDDEGVRLPPTKLTDEVREFFAQSSRLPEERYGDLRAQEAANHVGSHRLSDWLKATPSEDVIALNENLLAYSERLMRHVIETIPDGHYSFVDYLDDDGGSIESIPIRAPENFRRPA